MTIGEFKKMVELANIPDSAEMHIFNFCYEWYGQQLMRKDAWFVSAGDLVFDFGNFSDEYEVRDLHYQNAKERSQ